MGEGAWEFSTIGGPGGVDSTLTRAECRYGATNRSVIVHGKIHRFRYARGLCTTACSSILVACGQRFSTVRLLGAGTFVLPIYNIWLTCHTSDNDTQSIMVPSLPAFLFSFTPRSLPSSLNNKAVDLLRTPRLIASFRLLRTR